MTFNQSITQAMARTMQDLSDFVFINMANITLLRCDSYLDIVGHSGSSKQLVHFIWPLCSRLMLSARQTRKLATIKTRNTPGTLRKSLTGTMLTTYQPRMHRTPARNPVHQHRHNSATRVRANEVGARPLNYSKWSAKSHSCYKWQFLYTSLG